MANLPSRHPNLSLHLTDLSLTPLITSSSSRTHLESLTSLASNAITSQTTAQRAGLGRPQRILVEYPDSGPVIIQSFIDPRDLVEVGSSGSGSRTPGGNPTTAHEASKDDSNEADRPASPTTDENAPPVLVGVVVASSAEEGREARRAAARLEKIGRDFQKEWMAQGLEPGADGTDTPE